MRQTAKNLVGVGLRAVSLSKNGETKFFHETTKKRLAKLLVFLLLLLDKALTVVLVNFNEVIWFSDCLMSS